MEHRLQLKPFKDFLIDSDFNTLFSVLISMEPGYREAAYLNNYTYRFVDKVTPAQTTVKHLKLVSLKDFSENLGRKFQCTRDPISFREDHHFIEFLQGLINQEKLVAVGVDLSGWAPNGVCWNKHHRDHYTQVTGFDDARKVFLVFDETEQGYDEFEIPEEEFRMAIRNSNLEPHGYLIQISEIKTFELSLGEVAAYAAGLAGDLAVLNASGLWSFSDEDFAIGSICDLFITDINQIVNRHKANQLLFQTLQMNKMIHNPEMGDILIKYCLELQNGWSYVKAKFIRTFASADQDQGILDLNKKCNYLFGKELEMWRRFLACLS